MGFSGGFNKKERERKEVDYRVNIVVGGWYKVAAGSRLLVAWRRKERSLALNCGGWHLLL